MLDAHGCELRCSVMSDASQENQFIVARKEVSLHKLFYIHLFVKIYGVIHLVGAMQLGRKF